MLHLYVAFSGERGNPEEGYGIDISLVVAGSHSKARYLFWKNMRLIDHDYEIDGMIASGIIVRRVANLSYGGKPVVLNPDDYRWHLYDRAIDRAVKGERHHATGHAKRVDGEA